MRFSGVARGLFSAVPAFLDLTWNVNAAGNWSNAGNWTGGRYFPNGTTHIARLLTVITADRIVTLDRAITLNQLFIGDDQNYTISGTPALTMYGAAAVTITSTGTPTISCPIAVPTSLALASTPAATISGIISGAGSLTKSGAGAVTLSGVNTLSGNWTISAGTLSIAADSGLGTAPGSPVAANITIAGGAFLQFTGGFTLNANRGMTLPSGTATLLVSATMTYTGIIAGAGLLQKSNGSLLTLGTANTYSGGTTIAGGVLRIEGDGALGTAPGSPVANHISFGGGTLRVGTNMTLNVNRGITQVSAANSTFDILSGITLTYAGVITGVGGSSITKTSTGTLTLTGNSTYAGLTVSAGVVAGSANGAFGTGAVSITSGAAIQLFSSITVTGLAVALDSGGVASDGGIRSVSGTNIWTGTVTTGATANPRITCDAGNLTLSNIVLSSAGVLFGGNGTGTVSGVMSGVGGFGKSGTGTGTWTLSGANTFTGQANINGASLSIASLNSVSGGTASSNLGAPVTVGNGTILFNGTMIYTGSGETTDRVLDFTAIGGTITHSGTGLLKFSSATTSSGASAKTLTLQGSTAGTGEMGGAIVDNSGANKTSITKAGTNAWTLSGTCTYTGATTVSGGQLILTGILNAGSAVSISGGILRGTGTANGTVTVANVANSAIQGGTGGSLAGTLNTGALTFSGATAALNVTGTGAAVGLVNVTGTCALGGLVVNVLNATNVGTYNIIVASSTMSGTAPVLGTNSSGHGVTFAQVGNTMTMIVA